MWAFKLVQQKASLDRDNLASTSPAATAAAAAAVGCSNETRELKTDAVSCETDDDELTTQHSNSCLSLGGLFTNELDKLPSNYVAMRD